jgi:hypothetical protein
LVEGDYLSALGQYAQIGPGTFVRSLFVGSDPPFSPVAFKDEDVENVIRAALTSAAGPFQDR